MSYFADAVNTGKEIGKRALEVKEPKELRAAIEKLRDEAIFACKRELSKKEYWGRLLESDRDKLIGLCYKQVLRTIGYRLIEVDYKPL